MDKLISSEQLCQVSNIFPGKFIFLIVADHDTQKQDIAFSMRNNEDYGLGRHYLSVLAPPPKTKPESN